jgi:hypothetical protein
MSEDRYAFGDRVRHAKRPEWGIGSVVKAEHGAVNGQNGQNGQRLSVRFPGVGVKTFVTGHAELQRVTEDVGEVHADGTSDHPVRLWDRIADAEWLAPVAQRKIEEAMISLPSEARDPFRTAEQRLTYTLSLYRFDRTGRGLVDWAIAQTGLDDPLSRFNRHELEQYFDRWAFERDAHLGRVLQEFDGDPARLDALLAKAPPAARKAVRRHSALR